MARAEAPRPGELATAVLLRCEDKLSLPVGQAVSGWHEAAAAQGVAKRGGAASTPTGGARKAKRRAADDDDDGDDDSEAAATGGEEDEDDGGYAGSGTGAARERPFLCRETLHRLVLELAGTMPSVLTHVLPPLLGDLEDSDRPQLRKGVTALLGRVWALPRSMAIGGVSAGSGATVPLGRAYEPAFAAWCRRFRDRDAAVRLDAVNSGGEVLRAHASLAEPIARELAPRLHDPDDAVRMAVVVVVCDSACATLGNVPQSLLQGVAERGRRDKRMEIRREAVTGLAQAYAAHVPGIWQHAAAHATTHVDLPPPVTSAPGAASAAAAGGSPATSKKTAAGKRQRTDGSAPGGASLTAPWPGSASHYALTTLEGAVVAKLGWVPSVVMGAYEHPEAEMRLRVVQLLDHIMLPEGLAEPTRARGALRLYASLDFEARRALRHLLRDRLALQRLTHEFLGARAEVKGGAGGDGGARAR